jgi:hypothetical protein
MIPPHLQCLHHPGIAVFNLPVLLTAGKHRIIEHTLLNCAPDFRNPSPC